MKKLVSIMLVIILALSLFTAAFAANTGSITITNATKDQTYTVYRIFDASIKQDASGNTEAVSYSIKTTDQFFDALFATENEYFNYDATTGTVTQKDTAVDTELITYLTSLVKSGTYTPAVPQIIATGSEVKFENLPYGYYVILSSLGAAVTINSNTPDVKVIDKNQRPAPDFTKKIFAGYDENGDPIWADSNSASVGDTVRYTISFTATNYDAEKKIKDYQVHDKNGEALFTDLTSFEVTVGGTPLKKGYYLCEGDADVLNVDNLEFLGDWTGVAAEDKTRDNAEWYLVQIDKDNFRVMIPWLEGHKVTQTNTTYALDFANNAESLYAATTEIVVEYNAVITPDAIIGGGQNSNLYNKATALWTSDYLVEGTPDNVETSVYGIGLIKTDSSTGALLEGAQFRLYKDYDPQTKEYSNPVYVIPTDIDGVYILDSLNAPVSQVQTNNTVASRDLYADYLEGYLGADYATKQDNLVTTQVNGKLIVLGLEKGTYYLQEVKAPDGYNALSTPVVIEAGEGTKAFSIFVDANGDVSSTQSNEFTEKTYQLTSTTVNNSKGVKLPSTGGTGTIWLITIGTLVAIGFAIFLITHKKMSAYND